MRGKFYIDGKDAYSEWGITIQQNGYAQVIQLPSFKKLDSTEWDEYDGEEVDLTDPVLDSKTLQMQFNITNVSMAEDFFHFLSDGAYHIFNLVEIGRSYKLRLSQNSTLSSRIFLGKFTISLVDDFPPIRYEDGMTDAQLSNQYPYILNIKPYDNNIIGEIGYSFDDIEFGRLGVLVLEGTYNNIIKNPNVRDNLKIDNNSESGIIYDGEKVYYKTKDVQLKLLIHTLNIIEFWKRWDSLFTILIQPETRKLFSEEVIEEYECYYKSCNISKFDILTNGHVWCEFTVTVTFVDDRPSEGEYLLATEDFAWVITEEDKKYVQINKNK